MNNFKVTVPFVDDMGSISPFYVTETSMESKAQAALWHLNRMRDHDGLDHLTRMPGGTEYERVREADRTPAMSKAVEAEDEKDESRGVGR